MQRGSAYNFERIGLRLFENLLRIRRIEERLVTLYAAQEMRCPTHFSIGQEAVAVGVIAALQAEDAVLGAHRSHAIYLAKGGSLRRMIAELYGKSTGCTGGRGGSMHLVDAAIGFLGCTPIVGSTIPIAVGVAFGDLLQGRARTVAVFFGDGATESGIFHESLNFALLHRLPVLFVCENNLYSICTSLEKRQPAVRRIIDLAAGHGMEAEQCNGQDVEEVHRVADRLIRETRGGAGPRFVECLTYRFIEHCGPNSDLPLGYRTTAEFGLWQARDPILAQRQRLQAAGLLSSDIVNTMERRIEEELNAAIAFGHESPYPTVASLVTGVYAR